MHALDFLLIILKCIKLLSLSQIPANSALLLLLIMAQSLLPKVVEIFSIEAHLALKNLV